MAEPFIRLSFEARQELLLEAGRYLKREAAILEKDIWVCWALEVLFKLELPMVFKGGTSLSKVYQAIQRFSEDLDITIDHKASGDVLEDPLSALVSNTKRREFSERMRTFTIATVQDLILPHIHAMSKDLPINKIAVVENGDQIYLEYQAVTQSNYILPQIKLEFGARNAVEPSQIHQISADILAWDVANQLEFPEATVPVLLAERTYWEKVTLIHAEITRKNPKTTMERYSRHWYDLAQLSQHQAGIQAAQRFDLRDHVIRTKTALYGVAGVNYDAVAQQHCCLVPKDELNSALERDFNEMLSAGMFDGTPPTWDDIIVTLTRLEQQINQG